MTLLHVCYVESGYPHPHGGGGAGTYVQLVGRELIRRGHTVSVVAGACPECPPVSEDEGVTVYRPRFRRPLHWYLSKVPVLRTAALPLRYLEGGWKQYRFLQRLHRRNAIDVVEFTEGGDFWHAWRAPFPYVVHLHGSRYTVRKMSGRPVGRRDWCQRRLELFFVRRASHVVSPSRALLDIVTEEAGAPFKETTVNPYPLDPALLSGPGRNGHGNQSVTRVMFAARNDPVKGADVLLRAVPLVRDSHPDVVFDLYGYEPNGKKLPDGVRCHAFLPKDELLHRYHNADVCVIPSRWDNSPNTVYEAMAAGKAVVASNVGGIPELVIDGETGLLVEPGEPQALAQAIVSLLQDDERRLQMGRQGFRRVQRLVNLEENVDQRLSIYLRTINDFHNVAN